ncbi:hypothetical protein DOTSEDRAFT_68286 [Dothistroma septosporum NZE10]|uniref:Uncharacterized protein n=1 Tax=Dothistroma septosporum (strain NZE10 / CBS 128990) TaxID=675120 RepID=N1Q1B4_DOTSN|nr:hypothetical protein DOTSEDRAFT_68286 [Dothistroma septosporum NZE10]
MSDNPTTQNYAQKAPRSYGMSDVFNTPVYAPFPKPTNDPAEIEKLIETFTDKAVFETRRNGQIRAPVPTPSVSRVPSSRETGLAWIEAQHQDRRARQKMLEEDVKQKGGWIEHGPHDSLVRLTEAGQREGCKLLEMKQLKAKGGLFETEQQRKAKEKCDNDTQDATEFEARLVRVNLDYNTHRKTTASECSHDSNLTAVIEAPPPPPPSPVSHEAEPAARSVAEAQARNEQGRQRNLAKSVTQHSQEFHSKQFIGADVQADYFTNPYWNADPLKHFPQKFDRNYSRASTAHDNDDVQAYADADADAELDEDEDEDEICGAQQ